MSFTKTRQTKKEQEKQITLNNRLTAIAEEYTKINHEYKLSDIDKRELLFEKYKAKYPDTYQYDLQRINRIKMPGQNGKEYYTYVILEYVIDNANEVHENPRYHQGFHDSPIAKIHKNEFDEIDDTDINNWTITYEKTWYPEWVKKLKDGSKSEPTQFNVGIGVTRGKGSVFHNKPYTIHNFDEFLTGDFDDLFEMGKNGWSRNEGGGLASVKERRLAELDKQKKDTAEVLTRKSQR